MLSEFQKKKITRLFKFYDADGSGAIQANDFDLISKSFAQEFGWLAASEEERKFGNAFKQSWRRLLISADENGDEKISLEEFLNSYSLALSNDESYNTLIKGFIENIFIAIDIDHDNNWSKSDFIKFYKGFRNSAQEAENAFSKMDMNGDGTLSKEEVYKHFYDFHFSQDPQVAGNIFFGEF
jgi:juvenile hormone diol kinase